jgi:hypothetical protein
LLISFERKTEIVAPGIGNSLAGVHHLANDLEIVPLGFFIHRAVEREGADNILIDAGRLFWIVFSCRCFSSTAFPLPHQRERVKTGDPEIVARCYCRG